MSFKVFLLSVALLAGCTSSSSGLAGGGGSVAAPVPTSPSMPPSALTQEQVEARVREMWAGSNITSLSIEPTTIRDAFEREKLSSSFLPMEASVWLVIMEGDLKGPVITPSLPGQVSVEEGAARVAMLLPPEGGPELAMSITTKRQPSTFTVLPETRPVWYVGEVWGIQTTGQPVDGQLQLLIRNMENGLEKTYHVPYEDAAGFRLPLDSEHLPGFQDIPEQHFAVIIHAGDSRSEARLRLLKDRN